MPVPPARQAPLASLKMLQSNVTPQLQRNSVTPRQSGEVIELSQQELQRVKVIENAVMGRITVQDASRLLGISGRQVKRLKARYRAGGELGAARQPRAREAVGTVGSPATGDCGTVSYTHLTLPTNREV